VIDQPEENLDPKSIFEELVPQFRAARKRRQVVMVTHNANLVVNTDADQVIVAESVQGTEGSLPTISYQSGSLENPVTRALVCQVLEGGERPFWNESAGTDFVGMGPRERLSNDATTTELIASAKCWSTWPRSCPTCTRAWARPGRLRRTIRRPPRDGVD